MLATAATSVLIVLAVPILALLRRKFQFSGDTMLLLAVAVLGILYGLGQYLDGVFTSWPLPQSFYLGLLGLTVGQQGVFKYMKERGWIDKLEFFSLGNDSHSTNGS